MGRFYGDKETVGYPKMLMEAGQRFGDILDRLIEDACPEPAEEKAARRKSVGQGEHKIVKYGEAAV